MNKQNITEINKEFVKLVAENPDLPIKVFVSGDCVEDEEWVVGEIYDAKVTEIAVYDDRVYERDDIDSVKEAISNDVCDLEEYVNFTDEEFDKAMEEKAEWLGWEKVILLKVGI